MTSLVGSNCQTVKSYWPGVMSHGAYGDRYLVCRKVTLALTMSQVLARPDYPTFRRTDVKFDTASYSMIDSNESKMPSRVRSTSGQCKEGNRALLKGPNRVPHLDV